MCFHFTLISSPQNIVFDDVTYGIPGSSRVLASNVTLRVRPGCNVLITGPSGCGKTSLLRVLLRLWYVCVCVCVC